MSDRASPAVELWSTPRVELLRWYDARKRDLPWRGSRDPYVVWVSEIMLQQTRVTTVLPYFERFLERFPSVEALAEAPVDEVLALWSGLGYYRRARQMHAAARQLASEGRPFPTTAREMRELPGIGLYTSSAIASIAFGEVVPVMDGNVERVTARLTADDGDPKARATRSRLLAVAGKLLDPSRPGDSNQALMELGATVCQPRRPSCLLCPLETICAGKAQAEAFPAKKARRKVEKVELAVAVVFDGEGRVLLFRRSEQDELMAGMWELPHTPLRKKGEPAAQLERLEQRLGRRYGGSWQLETTDARARHGITYRAITLHAYRGRVCFDSGSVAEGPEAAWVGPREEEAFAVSSAVRKVLALPEIAGSRAGDG
ncbi:MAG: A/G-specific adenine glycosylase [Holophagales bacterium]|nr:A/G-specific adenine glycosylase [Holophagales bacterium]